MTDESQRDQIAKSSPNQFGDESRSLYRKDVLGFLIFVGLVMVAYWVALKV